jgi:hypothetical protein
VHRFGPNNVQEKAPTGDRRSGGLGISQQTVLPLGSAENCNL